MKILIALFLSVVAHGFLVAQITGKQFPEMKTETVEDKPVTLPGDVKGKFSIIGLAYSKKSEEDLNTWFEPIFMKFVQKPEGLFAGMGYDVHTYFVPMFTGVNAAAEGTAKKKAAKGINPQLLPHILFYKGELKPYKESLGFDKKDVPYVFVLNKEGKIIYATTGAFSDKKLDEIESVIE